MDGRRDSVSARGWRALTVGVPVAFLTLFFLYPLAAIIDRGLRGDGDSALSVLTDPTTREVVWFTVWQALASTVLTIAVAMPAAYVLGRYRFRGRSLVSALVVVPFVLPTVVVALAFVAILPDGIERGWAPILVAHAFFNVAVVVRIVGTYWANLDPRVGEAAATLGAGPVARFREITAPLLAPAVAAAAAIVFLFSFTSFGVVLILGGPRYATIEAEIYNQAVRLFDLRAAAVLSLVQLACVVAAVWVATRLERRVTTPGPLRAERDTLRRVRTRRDKLVVGASLGSLGLFLGLPLAVLVERSLAVGDGHGLDAYRALGRPTSVLLAAPWEAVVNSVVYAAAATLIALVVGGLAAFAVADRPTRGTCPGVRSGGQVPGTAEGDTRARRAHPAAARHVRGHARPRLPHRLRHAAARLPRGAVARSRRPGTRRDPVRRADRRADAPLDRPAPARGCRAARRVARDGSGERSTCRSSRAASLSQPGSRSRSHSASSARRSSSRGPTARRCPSRSFASSVGQARSTSRRPTRSRSSSWRSPSSPSSSSSGSACTAAGGSERAPRRGRHGSVRRRGRASTMRRSTSRRGEIVTVLGPSGSGKTTLLRVIAGLQPADAGRVVLDGEDLARSRSAPTRHRPRLPGSRALPAPGRLRQRLVRSAHARGSARSRRRTNSRAPRPRRPRRLRAIARSGRSRAESSSASHSRARSHPSRASFSSTSRSDRSIGALRDRLLDDLATLFDELAAHGRLRDARSDGGVHARRPGCGHACWASRPGRDAGRALGATARRGRRPLPRPRERRRR